jgi:hypothetical protein
LRTLPSEARHVRVRSIHRLPVPGTACANPSGVFAGVRGPAP